MDASLRTQRLDEILKCSNRVAIEADDQSEFCRVKYVSLSNLVVMPSVVEGLAYEDSQVGVLSLV